MAACHLFPLIYRSRGSPTGARFSFSDVDVGRSSAAPMLSAAPVLPVSSAASVLSAAPKKKIEVASFGRLDQMLKTAVQGEASGVFAPLSQN